MPVFKVEQAIQIPLHRRGGVDIAKVKEICENPIEPLRHFGCYIFAVKRQRTDGWLPVYVGRASKQTLAKEALSDDKIGKLNGYLQDFGETQVRLYLVTHPIQSGRQNMSAIDDMETWLIDVAHEMNRRLINKQGVQPKGWGIAGLIRGGRGKRSKEATELRKLLGLDQDAPSPPAPDENGNPGLPPSQDSSSSVGES